MINTAYINNHHKGGYSTQKLKDISQATTQSLGISKNYKIDATQMQTLVKNLSQNKHFDTIDFTKTLENAYKVFSNLMQFSKNELPLGFEMDKNSFEILKIYDKAQDLENNFLNENNSYKGSKVVINLKDLNSKDKSFMNFANVVFNQFGGGYLIEGQSNISGKLMGFDKNMDKNQIQDLNDFIKNNSFIANGSMEKLMEALDLFSSNLSIEEFKQKWLNLTINLEPSNKTIEQIVREDLKAKEEQKPRTPIQSESQNKETYKDNNISSEFLKKLLENSFNKAKELELLFGMKFSDDDAGE
ncbi:hypothetical protein DUH45_09050, partial [Campylobacter coli]|nr:hypothetical protein [Campylobacter coli]EJG9923426.1 hypothetical protein [Campylobacter coli]